MKKSIWKKGLILAIIMLFIGASVTPNILVRNVRADPPGDSGLDNIYFGKYHNLVWPGNSKAYITPEQDSFSWDDYPMGDKNNPDDYATVAEEPVSISKAEICSVITNYKYLTTGGTVAHKWYKNSNNDLLFTFEQTIPNPQSYGYDYWEWYSIFSWIGKFPSEIDEPGEYYVHVTSPWNSNYIYFTVEETNLEDITKITDNTKSDSGAVLIKGDSGTYYMVYQSRTYGVSSLDIYLTRSSDLINWDTPVKITTYGDRDSNPYIAEADNGDLLVTYGSTMGYPWGWKTYLTRSTDGGDSWSTPVLIEPYCSGDPCILKASDGTLYLSLHRLSGTSKTKVRRSTDNGYTWTLVETISNHPYVLHSVMREYDGNLFMICDSRQDVNPNPSNLYFYKSTDDGDTWVEQSSITSSYEDRAPTFVKTDDGEYIVIWRSDDRDSSGSWDFYYSTSDDFINWETPQPLIEDSSCNFASPELFKDTDGEIYFTWSDDSDGDHEIYLSKFFDLTDYSGLVAYWSFDDGTATDNSGNGNDGIIHGPTVTTGISGSALSFDGVDDWIEVPDSDSLTPSNELTLECWVKLTKLNVFQYVLLKDAETNKGWDHPYVINIYYDNKIHFGIGDGVNQHGVVSSTALLKDVFYHIVGTYDNEYLRIYINGVEDASKWVGSMTLVKHDKALKIGRIKELGIWYYPFNGIIDEVYIYSRALSASEIEYNYNNPGGDGTNSIIIQPSSQDSYIDRWNPDDNYGSDSIMKLLSTFDEGAVWFSYVQFDLSSIPIGKEIISAKLKLRCTSSGTPADIDIFESSEDWNENTITWGNTRKEWYPSPKATTYIDSTGWYSWDVTEHVNNWYSGVHANYGFVMVQTDFVPHSSEFVSKEHSNSDFRPMLDITYSEGVNDPPNIENILTTNKPYSGLPSDEGQVNERLKYNIIISDPERNNVYYFVDWGDGTVSGWTGPYNPGEEIEISHQWKSGGANEIKVKAIDDPNEDEDLSDGLESDEEIFTNYIHYPTYRILVVPVCGKYQSSDMWYETLPQGANNLSISRDYVDYISDYYMDESFGLALIEFKFTESPIHLYREIEYYFTSVPPRDLISHIQPKINENDYDSILILYQHPCFCITPVSIGDYALVDFRVNWRIWAHEIGHSLFGFVDYYTIENSNYPTSGNIGYWGLMGRGPDLVPPAPIFCRNKMWKQWLSEKDYTIEDQDTPVIIPLEDYYELNKLDDIPHILIKKGFFSYYSYHFEAQSNNHPLNRNPWKDPEISGIVIYRTTPALFTKTFDWTEYLYKHQDYPTIRKKDENNPENSYYFDIDTGLNFTYVNDPDGIEPYEPSVKVFYDNTDKSNMNGAIGNIIPELLDIFSFSGKTDYFDIDIHAYSIDGLHIGMNYETGQYETEIPGAIYSWNHSMNEYIIVPKGISVHFETVLRGSFEGTVNYTTQIFESGPNPSVEIIDGITKYNDWNFSEKVLRNANTGDVITDLDDDGIPFYQEILDGTNPNDGPILSPYLTVSVNPSSSFTKENTFNLHIKVKAGDINISGATINISTEEGISFSDVEDLGNGDYSTTVTIPESYPTNLVNISINASRNGFINGSTWIKLLLDPATIDIDPDTLNLKSKGKWITCYIELPEGYNVTNINISTILLNDVVPAESHPTNISDYDNDGIPDLMVKFDRQEVQEILEPGDEVEIVVTGQLMDETGFEGIDYIRVI